MNLSQPDFFPTQKDRLQDCPGQNAMKAIRLARVKMIRVQREENLLKIFPPELQNGCSYHFLSTGDIDALSYLITIADRYGPFDHVYASTWTMSREDCMLLGRYLAAGTIAKLIIFCGDYFASRETSVYGTLRETVARYSGSAVYLFKNHCKLLILANAAAGFYCVVEGSANFTTNPRAEQTVVTVNRELHDFYRDWFEEIRNE